MPGGALDRIGAVAGATLRSSLNGRRPVGLLLVSAVFPLLVLAVASGHRTGIDLVAASEELYSALFLPVLLLLVCLVMGSGLLRGEIEDDTIVYPVMRSLPRWTLVVGKFAGFVLAALLFLLPAALLGPAFAIVFNAGPQVSLDGLAATLVTTTVVAVLAYGAFFLLLGLLTRQALVLGLIYGFFWETFVPLLPGPLKQLTVVYYLRQIGGHLASAGPLASASNPVGLGTAILVPLLFALALLVLTCAYIAQAELRPAPTPA